MANAYSGFVTDLALKHIPKCSHWVQQDQLIWSVEYQLYQKRLVYYFIIIHYFECVKETIL